MPAIVGYDYSWWVDYSWSYEVFDEENQEWVSEDSFEAERFSCRKKDIKKEAKKRIEDRWLCGVQYRNLKVRINDCYMTTACEC